MCITILCLPSWIEAFCFTGPWINHTFHPSILSSIMHFLYWVRMIILVTEWVSEWMNEQMRPWLHPCPPPPPHSKTLAILSSLAPLPSPFPSPQPPSLPSAVILFKDCYLYPSSQVSQVKTANQPTREAHSYRGCTAPLLLVYGRRDSKPQTLFLYLIAYSYSLFATPRALAPTSP